MTANQAVRKIIEEVLFELERNPDLADRLRLVLNPKRSSKATSPEGRRPRRRAPSAFDPFAVYEEGGESSLHNRLRELDLERLKDMVADHGMDPMKLAMKWRTQDRLVDLIVRTVHDRARKGDAFRSPSRAKNPEP